MFVEDLLELFELSGSLRIAFKSNSFLERTHRTWKRLQNESRGVTTRVGLKRSRTSGKIILFRFREISIKETTGERERKTWITFYFWKFNRNLFQQVFVVSRFPHFLRWFLNPTTKRGVFKFRLFAKSVGIVCSCDDNKIAFLSSHLEQNLMAKRATLNFSSPSPSPAERSTNSQQKKVLAGR